MMLLAASSIVLVACGKVNPGYVGIKVNNFNGGVEGTVLGVGYYFTPPGTDIKEYATYTQNKTYSASPTEGGTTNNEEFQFQDQRGVNVTADIGLAYSVNPDLAPKLYAKFRTDGEGLLDNQIRNKIRSALVTHASGMTVEDIYGPRKVELLNSVQREVADYFRPYGLNIESLSWLGGIRVPDSVRDQLVARVANENGALAAQANVAKATAEANSRIEQAKGEAEANHLLAASIQASPQIVQLKAIEKWDGHLPTYASNGPLPFIGNTGK